MSVSLNQIVATIVLSSFILYNLLALPKLIRELIFYSRNGWNLKIESPQQIPLQDGFRGRFAFLPIGFVKLKVLFLQTIMGIVPLWWWISHIIFRK